MSDESRVCPARGRCASRRHIHACHSTRPGNRADAPPDARLGQGSSVRRRAGTLEAELQRDDVLRLGALVAAQLRGFDDYRNYICRSRAEFSVAHNRYVEFKTGWFSDRSALYLAAGKPVLVQSTGIEAHLPTGKGLLTFSSIDEAVAGIEATPTTTDTPAQRAQSPSSISTRTVCCPAFSNRSRVHQLFRVQMQPPEARKSQVAMVAA